MRYFSATFFLESEATARSDERGEVLRVEPDGAFRGGCIAFQFPQGMARADRVAGADRILAAVQEWHTRVRADAEAGEST